MAATVLAAIIHPLMPSTLPTPAPGKTESVSGLHAGADSVALSRLSRKLKKPLVIIRAIAFEAQRLL